MRWKKMWIEGTVPVFRNGGTSEATKHSSGVPVEWKVGGVRNESTIQSDTGMTAPGYTYLTVL